MFTILANMVIVANSFKSPNVCKSVPYMVASHVGESGESGEFGDFGEFLSNRQMYVNQFHTWWPAMLANLANTVISGRETTPIMLRISSDNYNYTSR